MAAPTPSPPEVARFGEFELDFARGELSKNGSAVTLAPQPLRVLVLLVSHAGELVTRETIRQELWGEDITVDFEHGLNSCIRLIRAALGDDARSWRFIETVHRRGYRFHLGAAGARHGARTARLRIAGLIVAAAVLVAIGYIAVTGKRDARRARAHDLVVQGRMLSARLTSDGQRSAIALFERALALDPRSAEAQAGLAYAYMAMALDGGIRESDARLWADQAAKTALTLNAELAEAHLALAMTRYRLHHDWRGADLEFRRALTLSPANANSHASYGTFLYLQGRFDESETHLRQALALDPISEYANYQFACMKYYRRDYTDAIAACRATLDMNPRHAWAHHVLGLALLAKEQFAEAIAEFEKSQRGPSGNLGHAYGVAGRRSEALKVLDQLQSRYDRERIGAGNIAQVYIGLGDYDRALAWLNTEFSDGGSLATLFVAPVLDPLRNDPRFQDLLQRFRAPDN